MPFIGVQGAHAADEDRHLRHGQRQHVCAIDQQFGGRTLTPLAEIVSEAIGRRLERGEGRYVGKLLRGIYASRRKRHLDGIAGLFRGIFDRCAARQDDQVGQGHLLPVRVLMIELGLDALQAVQHLREIRRVIGGPVLLRCESDPCAVGAAAMVGAAIRGG